MYLAEVIGQVVATKKDDSMKGRKLLLLRPKLVDEAKPEDAKPESGDAPKDAPPKDSAPKKDAPGGKGGN